MEWISHTATGFLIGQALLKPEDRPKRAGWWWALAAISPDWLELLTRWFGDIHRGVTHSLYLWPILALAWALAARRWGGEQTASLKRLWMVFLVIVGSHMLLDVFMAYRWYLAWPFVQTRWAWDIMPFFDVFIFAGWLILILVHRRWKLPSVMTAKIGLAIFLVVFSFRLVGKVRAESLALDLQTGTPRLVDIRTFPDYFQPWVWYAKLSPQLPEWSAINIVTGEVVSDGTMINPLFPPIPIRETLRKLSDSLH
jgi:membrane-bound metal-dependent hydrolase YbcI (DUF457 family)